ncbi:MAG: 2-hydroxychromene-2-carboxylate isomerase [Alphaproteobacteria bacterium]|nr:2-hydroxychromene-2-carboxylate isomerase [Alphaproteobacteria bacterium]MDX5415148.1 2-hydroxychromene-2-carboxylate isomerase [Alphaproteobacteria bacterium]MDX5492339.1 2-hydroxychromene-2-carboxylate isomerase [Alphaproteobacteria bacterium]
MGVEFWYEFASTYSYPAAMRVESDAKAAGVTLRWRPFLLGPIFGAQGWNDSPFNIYPAKVKYMWRDMARICEAAGLTLKEPVRFPQNGLKAARLALLGQDEAWGPEFTRRVYLANFAEQKDISDENVLAEILTSLSLDAAVLMAQSNAQDNKDRLKAQTEEAVRRGIFGAPSFLAGDELFWGNDRLEAALDWARR